MTTILKCKMCGGTLEIQGNETVAKCRYCGSVMTLPKVDSDQKARIFNRANEYRLNNDFDKAYDAYKSIVEADPTEAEAYWGMILSEYGIEYVEDPKTGQRIPTCHRTQTTPVVNNTNYKMALQYADPERKMLYQDEAEALDKLQKTILSVSSREEPYDVFISYKETDDSTGERTEDSVIAQDIYNELNRAGIRTFFSRISLEDHLGENYEPYIYAALQSAKILVTVSTKAENLESAWVKNEWMRFLRLMDNDKSKMIIPVYKGMTAYELPTLLSGYQAQDLTKLGATQDLVHGIERFFQRKEVSEKDALLNQVLEKQKKEIEEQQRKAKAEAEALERKKKREAEEARIAKEKKEKAKAALNKNKKWIIAGAISIITVFVGAFAYKNYIGPSIKYNSAVKALENSEYDKAYNTFISLGDYKDSKVMVYKTKYAEGKALLDAGDLEGALAIFNSISDYEDSKLITGEVNEQIKDGILQAKYETAVAELDKGLYKEAIDAFNELGEYKDSADKKIEAQYGEALLLLDNKEYPQAISIFERLNGYSDSDAKMKEAYYKYGVELISDGKYTDAIKQLELASDYSDTKDQLLEAKYQMVISDINDVSDRIEEYNSELLKANYKDIQAYQSRRDARKAIMGLWIGNYGSYYKVNSNSFKHYQDRDYYEHDQPFDTNITYSFDEGTQTFEVLDNSWGYSFTAVVSGNQMIITPKEALRWDGMDYFFSGTYTRTSE